MSTAGLVATPGHRRRALLRGAVTVLALLSGCTTGTTEPGGYLPSGPAVVNLVEQDHGYVLDRDGDIPPGRTVFRVRNPSNLVHRLSLVVLPEDLPPIKEQLQSPNRRAITTLALLPSRRPGSRDAFAVDLAPGRYALLCFEKDATGNPHALMGMAIEFRVAASSGQEDAGK